MELMGAENPSRAAPASHPCSRISLWCMDRKYGRSAGRTQASKPRAQEQAHVLGGRWPKLLKKGAQAISNGGQAYVSHVQKVVDGAHGLVRALACGHSTPAQVNSATMDVASIYIDCMPVGIELGPEDAQDPEDGVIIKNILACGLDTDVDLSDVDSQVDTAPASPRRVRCVSDMMTTPLETVHIPVLGLVVQSPAPHSEPSAHTTPSPTYEHAVEASGMSIDMPTGTSSPAHAPSVEPVSNTSSMTQAPSTELSSGTAAAAAQTSSTMPASGTAAAQTPNNEQQTGDALVASAPSGTSSKAPQSAPTSSIEADQVGLAIRAQMRVADQLKGSAATALKVAAESRKMKVPDHHLSSSRAEYSHVILQQMQASTAQVADLLVTKEKQAAQIAALQRDVAELCQSKDKQEATVAALQSLVKGQLTQLSDAWSILRLLKRQLSDSNPESSLLVNQEFESMLQSETAADSSKEMLQLVKGLSTNVLLLHLKEAHTQLDIKQLWQRLSVLGRVKLTAEIGLEEQVIEGREVEAEPVSSDTTELLINSSLQHQQYGPYVPVQGKPQDVWCKPAKGGFVWECEQRAAAYTQSKNKAQMQQAATGSRGDTGKHEAAAHVQGTAVDQQAAANPAFSADKQQDATERHPTVADQAAAAQRVSMAYKQASSSSPGSAVASDSEMLQSSKLQACDVDKQLAHDNSKQTNKVLANDSSKQLAHDSSSPPACKEVAGGSHKVQMALVACRTYKCEKVPRLERPASGQGLASTPGVTQQQQQQQAPISAPGLDMLSQDEVLQAQLSVLAGQGISADVLQGMYGTDAPVIEAMDAAQMLQAAQDAQGDDACSTASVALQQQQQQQRAAGLADEQPQVDTVPDMSMPAPGYAALFTVVQSCQQQHQAVMAVMAVMRMMSRRCQQGISRS